MDPAADIVDLLQRKEIQQTNFQIGQGKKHVENTCCRVPAKRTSRDFVATWFIKNVFRSTETLERIAKSFYPERRWWLETSDR